MRGVLFAVLIVAAVPGTPVTGTPETASQQAIASPAQGANAPPIIDIALRLVRAAVGGSSIARSAVRGDEPAYLYAGLGPCVIGAAAEDPAHENSMTWRASGRVRSVDRGIAVADVEWQRLEHRPAGTVAAPRVRTTLTLPLGERLAVDFADVSGSMCRTDGLIFEIGVAADHGRRLAMSGEGRSEIAAGAGARGGGGGGVGRRLTPPELAAQADRWRQTTEAARAAPVVTRPMPPREYTVDAWLAPDTPAPSSAPALAQRLSQVVGGTGGRFAFPPISFEAGGNRAVQVDISALVIPIDGERLVVAITRHVATNGESPVSAGWIKVVPLPKAADVLSFEIPAPDVSGTAVAPRQGQTLTLRVLNRQ